MKNLPQFYVFGSPSSKDADILVLVDSIPKTHEAKFLCKQYQDLFQPFFKKEVNANIGILNNGQIIAVLKGTLDEVNNSIIDTYQFHKQEYPLLLLKRVERSIELKILRSTRIVLSNLSRTQYRALVKESLRNDLKHRIDTLSTIDLSQPILDSKKPLSEVYKTIGFQMGQALGLIEGHEFYTKEAVAQHYPELADAIMRNPDIKLNDLESFKKRFIDAVNKYIPSMTTLIEPALNEQNRE